MTWNTPLSRRDALRTLAASSTALFPGWTALAQSAPRKPRVAAINSIYRLRSHAYHIAGRFIYGYTREGVHHQPPFDLVRQPETPQVVG